MHRRRIRARILTASLLTAAFATPAGITPSSAATAPCAQMGKATIVGSVLVPACSTFASGPAAIRLPSDTSTTAYGMVYERGGVLGAQHSSSAAASAVFVNRKGGETTGPSSLVPPALQGKRTLVQFVFKATKSSGRITGLTPVLFVPTGAMVKPFAGAEFHGILVSQGAPDNVDSNAWVRWDMAAHISGGKLAGQFTNLNKSVKTGMMFEPPSPCAYSLQLPANGDWFTKVLGSSPKIRLEWNPAMHASGDSEWVMFMGSGVSFMTHAPRVNELLAAPLNAYDYREFTIHGNPMSTPYQFQGMFSEEQPAPACGLM